MKLEYCLAPVGPPSKKPFCEYVLAKSSSAHSEQRSLGTMMPRTRLMLSGVLVLLLSSSFCTAIHCREEGAPTWSPSESGHIGTISEVSISEYMGETLLEEDFDTPPLGFSPSIWNLTAINDPSFSWVDDDRLQLFATPFTGSILTTLQEFGSSIIVDMNISFFSSACYFSIGWCDGWERDGSEWIIDFRACQNGVFIDCWDGDLFLATYEDGKRTVAPVRDVELTHIKNFKIAWTTSLVFLEIDGESKAYTTTNVPDSSISFSMAISGHHYLSGNGQLLLDYVQLCEFTRSPQPSDPQILHLWPANGSVLYPDDLVDFHILGTPGPMYYSWDEGVSIAIDAPWDVPAPTGLGNHTLCVRAMKEDSSWVTEYYAFCLRAHPSEFLARYMVRLPVADGLLTSEEMLAATQSEIVMRNEWRETFMIPLALGFTESFFYIAIESPMPDAYHSRAAIFLDGNADGLWNDSESDIYVAAAAPCGDPVYNRVGTPSGSGMISRSAEGVLRASGAGEDTVAYEFMIAYSAIGVNISDGINLGIVVSNGGMDVYIPGMKSMLESTPLIVGRDGGTTGADSPLYDMFLVLGTTFGIMAIAGAAIVAVSERFSLEHSLRNRKLERLKLLLFSYDRISIDRLSRLIGSDSVETEDLVAELLYRGFPAHRGGRDIVRSTQIEKREKGV